MLPLIVFPCLLYLLHTRAEGIPSGQFPPQILLSDLNFRVDYPMALQAPTIYVQAFSAVQLNLFFSQPIFYYNYDKQLFDSLVHQHNIG